MNKLKLFVFALGLGTVAQAQTLQDANKKTENERYDLARGDYQKLVQADPNSVENAFFFGNFYAIAIEKRNIEDKLEVIVLEIPDIGVGPLGVNNPIALFPNAQCVGFDAGNVFNIFDEIFVAIVFF